MAFQQIFSGGRSGRERKLHLTESGLNSPNAVAGPIEKDLAREQLHQLMDRSGSSTNSSGSVTGDICRICHGEAEPEAPLLVPCRCLGSMRYVHQKCLQRWIKSSQVKNCELCKYEFQMQSKTKPFNKWEKLDMSPVERRKILCSVTFHMIAITCVVWSLYVLIDRTTEEIARNELEWPFWTKLIVVAIGFTGGLVFMYVQCKMYIQLCRRWKTYNRVIYIETCTYSTETSSPPANVSSRNEGIAVDQRDPNGPPLDAAVVVFPQSESRHNIPACVEQHPVSSRLSGVSYHPRISSSDSQTEIRNVVPEIHDRVSVVSHDSFKSCGSGMHELDRLLEASGEGERSTIVQVVPSLQHEDEQ